MRNQIVWTVLLVGVLAGTPSLQALQQPSDAELQSRVEAKLQEEDRLENRVQVSVEDGVVTLKGKVQSVWAKNRAAQLALEVPEVAEVLSEMEIARAESDQEIVDRLRDMVLSYSFYTIFDDINIGVNNGIVTLDGKVTWGHKVNDLVSKASRIFGVQEVINEIDVLPVNIGDEELRRRLAERIYGDTLFSDLAFRRNPPIHIIVERGRVTLTGAVRSKVEKARAESIARSTFGVFAVENKLQIGS